MKIIQQQIISFNSACEQGTGHFLSVLSKDNFWEVHNGLSLWGRFQSLVAFFCNRIGMDGHILYSNICDWPICFLIHWQFL